VNPAGPVSTSTVSASTVSASTVSASTVHAFHAPGFADPTRDAQRAFRAVLDAMAHPTRSFPLTGPAKPPAALGRGLAAVALTLLDEDCAVWLGGALAHDAEVAAWVAFHTGARRVHAAAAAGFVIADPRALPPLESLALGTDEAPHLSATVVLDIRGCAGFPNTGLPNTGLPNTVQARFTAAGPGIDGTAALAAPWATDGFADAWHRNTGIFPRGVDLLLVDEDTVAALPRTTHLTAADQELED
jgi:alpha-D-ribose 1-methylphosphonate 5-triphosphate synthase subunit PhnH